MNWSTAHIPDQTGKEVIVTGANSGIGFEAALALAEKGASVSLAVRNSQKGETAKQQILTRVPNAQVKVLILDLASLSSVESFSQDYAKAHDRLDILINNAGIMVPPYAKTEDGFESQMGTNHMGHFALTAQLFPLLEKTPKSRIVNVSSTAHNMGNIDFDDLTWEKRRYLRWRAYGDSKIANLYFTYELKQRLEAKALDMRVTAAHPGWAATDLQKTSLLKCMNSLFAQDAAAGALPTLRAATDPEAQSGDFYGPKGMFESRGYPVKVSSNARSQDQNKARQLWAISEKLTQVSFPV